MWSTGYATPLVLEPGTSKHLQYLLYLTHLGPLPLLMPLQLPWWIKLLCGLGLVISLIRLHSVYLAQSSARRLRRLEWQQGDQWVLGYADTFAAATLIGDVDVRRYWVLLRFRLDAGGTRSMLLMRDAVDTESFRRLRVRLRIQRE